ncbi:MAG: type IV pilus modification protein PilV [Pseudomonadota bacterium]
MSAPSSRPHPLPSSQRRRQQGLSLIEVLVTLVVISIGMLGIAALYVESLRVGYTALSRTRAVSLAADMADRIRGNGAGEEFYTADAAAASNTAPFACAQTGGAPAADCTADELAAYDVWQWKTLIGNSSSASAQQLGLPGGVGTIEYDNTTAPSTFTITVSWQERDEALSYSLALAI